LAAAIERALAKNPHDRFATAEDFAAALAPFASGADTRRLATDPTRRSGPDGAAAPAAVDETSRPQSTETQSNARRRFIAAGLAGAVCVAAVGYGLFGGGNNRHEQTAGKWGPPNTQLAPSPSPQPNAGPTRRASDEPRNRATDLAVRWVLSQGGFVQGYIDYVRPFQMVTIRNAAGLPTQAYTVTMVNLAGLKTVDDAALANLAPVDSLAQLDLADTAVSDDALRHVEKWPGLSRLDLTNTRVTDTGLAHLHGAAFLSTLKLAGTPVTDAGVAALKEALPKCTVER
jgi:hypothetical protein